MKSKYKNGIIGLRLTQKGESTTVLKKLGAIILEPQELNNRNAFNSILLSKTNEQFRAFDFSPMAEAGAEGFAVFITEAQWKINSGVTENQWIARRLI